MSAPADKISAFANRVAADIEESQTHASGLLYEAWGSEWTNDFAAAIERHLRAFLANREAEQAGALAALRGALEEAREAIASLPEDALGDGRCAATTPDGEAGEMVWPLRDELVDRITKALASGAGRAEAEVLRAVDRLCRADLARGNEAPDPDRENEFRLSLEHLHEVHDTLRAARGGEGEG